VLSFRRIFGGDVDPVLKPVLVSVGFGALGQFAFFAFFAVWALTQRDAPATHVGLAYTCSALAAVGGSLLGGRVSDRIGRQPVIFAGASVQALAPVLLLVPDLPLELAYGVLVTMGFSQPIRGTAQRALLADLVGDERREEAFGAFRVVLNAGATLGPVVGAGLVSWRWDSLFAGITFAFALSSLAALRLPESARRPAVTGLAPSVLPLLRDRAFLAVFVATVAGWCTYSAFELLTPISLTQSHGLEPATWGLLYALNPVVIVLLQLRVTRWASFASRGARLAAGVLLMGTPYFLLELNDALAVIVAVLLVVVLGEMLWAPASEALVAGMAPPALRGVYLGTANAASWGGMALAPAFGLQARAAFGERGMWLLVAGIACAGAILYLVAARRAEQESARDRSPLGYQDEADPRDAPGDRRGGGRGRAAPRRPDGQPARATGR
jgi:predicted MFS family arabinose efflux permease